jgi:hypothetical protein
MVPILSEAIATRTSEVVSEDTRRSIRSFDVNPGLRESLCSYILRSRWLVTAVWRVFETFVAMSTQD